MGPASQFAFGDSIRVKSGYDGRHGPYKMHLRNLWGYIVAGRLRAGSSDEYEFRSKMPNINCTPKRASGSGPWTFDEVMAAPEQWECWISESALEKKDSTTVRPEVETTAEKPCHRVLAAQGFKIGTKVRLMKTVVVPGHDPAAPGFFGYIKTFSATGSQAHLMIPGCNVQWDGHKSFEYYAARAPRYVITVPLHDLAVWT